MITINMTGVPEKEESENVVEIIFEGILVNNLPKQFKDIKPQIQDLQTSSRINAKEYIIRPIEVKLLKAKVIQMILNQRKYNILHPKGKREIHRFLNRNN